jgi:hypothetical protein
MIHSSRAGNQKICWRVVSGQVLDVQKYTKTHVTTQSTLRDDKNWEYDTSVSSWIEMVVELRLQQDNGSEVRAILRKRDNGVDVEKILNTHLKSAKERGISDIEAQQLLQHFVANGNIQVYNGQYVSLLTGYTTSRESDWLMLVNHDDQQWFWVATPRLFFASLGIFANPKKWHLILILPAVTALVYLVSPSTAAGVLILGTMLCFKFGAGFIGLIQDFRISKMFSEITPHPDEIARQLME